MTHEELVTVVELAIDETLRTNRYNLQRSRVAAREAIRITDEALYQSIRERMAAIEYCKPSELTPACTINLRSVDNIFKSLTQGTKT